jgi:hypothetical protein
MSMLTYSKTIPFTSHINLEVFSCLLKARRTKKTLSKICTNVFISFRVSFFLTRCYHTWTRIQKYLIFLLATCILQQSYYQKIHFVILFLPITFLPLSYNDISSSHYLFLRRACELIEVKQVRATDVRARDI